MTLRVEIENLRISDGTAVEVPVGGIVAFVGPNNAGKSLALRNIRDQLSSLPPGEPLAVTGLEIKREGSEEELQQWLDTHCHRQGSGPYATYGRFGQMSSSSTLSNLLDGWLTGRLGTLGTFFTYFGNGETRLGAANPAQMINFRRDPNTQPLHYLYRDEPLEARLSRIAKRAFGIGLILDRWAGTELPLQVGDLTRPRFDSAIPPPDYLQSLAALPPLHGQGDGMKSFVGILLNLIAADYFFVLIDEPEAFLHPPQAQLLGQMLAAEKAPSTQIFLATHSSDILRGLLDSSASSLTIVRLTHEGDINPTAQLDPGAVRELWQDPLLRYSNILDGLFNEAVILCEADSDCRYYASVLDSVLLDQVDARRPELLFTHCGGKARMPNVVTALRSIGLPIRVIADFDILNAEQPLRRLIEALGGQWGTVYPPWNIIKRALDSESRQLATDYVRQEITMILDAVNTPTIPPDRAERIRQLLRPDSGWDKAKRSGKASLPQADATRAYDELDTQLRELGLFVVEVGELERFVPSVSGKGPAWLRQVYEQGLHADPSIEAPRKLATAVLNSVRR